MLKLIKTDQIKHLESLTLVFKSSYNKFFVVEIKSELNLFSRSKWSKLIDRKPNSLASKVNFIFNDAEKLIRTLKNDLKVIV